jgi:hypothetical protein
VDESEKPQVSAASSVRALPRSVTLSSGPIGSYDNWLLSSIENQVFSSTPEPQIVAADVELHRSLYDELSLQIERMFTEGRTIVTIRTASGTSKVETFVNRGGQTAPKAPRAEGVSPSKVGEGKVTAHRFLWPRDLLFP